MWSRRQFLAATGLAGVAQLLGVTPARAAYAGETVVTGHAVLSGDWTVPGLTVEAGATLEFDPATQGSLTSTGNVVVNGTLRMGHGPAQHLLRFTGVNEAGYVGGGMDPIPSDVGLWVMGAGVLNISGVPRSRWNRTGTDPTWVAGDEVRVAPQAANTYTFPVFTPGSAVPAVTYRGVQYKSEVLNLTASVRIEGTAAGRAHIFIRSTAPQTVKHAAIRWMGPRQPDGTGYTDSVTGRYGLHFHHCEDGSRGSLVEGVVVRDCGGHAFVPHGSHGITFRDCLSYQTMDDAYWWDEEHRTHDVLWDHCAVFGTKHDPISRGNIAGFLLGLGTGNVVRDCVAVAVEADKDSSGFHWPSFANLAPDNLWTSQNLTAHNNRGDGIFVWQNDKSPHHVDVATCYRNRSMGVHAGAYGNNYHWNDLVLFGNTDADLAVFAVNVQAFNGGSVQDLEFRRVTCDRVKILHHGQSTTYPAHLWDLTCSAVIVDEYTKPNAGVFVLHADLTLAQITRTYVRSAITVQRPDGTSFVVPKT